MKKFIFYSILGVSFLISCQETSQIQAKIQSEINKSVEATKNKDIEEYMKRLPNDALIYDESGEIITAEKQKKYVLRDWSIIDTTLNIYCKIDSLQTFQDSAIVYTAQRWERLMFRQDGVTKDTVVTTQIHKEIWKKKSDGWKNYEVFELGGQIFINGQIYNQ